jgi:hypothetical protein
MIIGITGRAGAGKDTVADILVERHSFVRVALADEIKRSSYPRALEERQQMTNNNDGPSPTEDSNTPPPYYRCSRCEKEGNHQVSGSMVEVAYCDEHYEEYLQEKAEASRGLPQDFPGPPTSPGPLEDNERDERTMNQFIEAVDRHTKELSRIASALERLADAGLGLQMAAQRAIEEQWHTVR